LRLLIGAVIFGSSTVLADCKDEWICVARGQRIAYSGNTQSIPVRFQSANGIIDRPRRGARYQAF